MTYIGIDLHKNYCYVVAIDQTGQKLAAQKVPHQKDVWQKFLSSLPAPHIAVVESTLNRGFLIDWLEELNVNAFLANPLKLRAIADAKIKTDSIDASTLATLLRGNLIPPS